MFMLSWFNTLGVFAPFGFPRNINIKSKHFNAAPIHLKFIICNQQTSCNNTILPYTRAYLITQWPKFTINPNICLTPSQDRVRTESRSANTEPLSNSGWVSVQAYHFDDVYSSRGSGWVNGRGKRNFGMLLINHCSQQVNANAHMLVDHGYVRGACICVRTPIATHKHLLLKTQAFFVLCLVV